MSNRGEKTGYVIALLLVCGFLLGWKFFLAPERSVGVDEYRRQLDVTRTNIFSPFVSENPDQSLKIYAVNVVGTHAFKPPVMTYGIYLGWGRIVTGGQVVGHYPFATSPHVLIAGIDLPAKIIRIGPAEQ